MGCNWRRGYNAGIVVIAVEAPQELLQHAEADHARWCVGTGPRRHGRAAWGRWRAAGVTEDADPWSDRRFSGGSAAGAGAHRQRRAGPVAAWASWGRGAFCSTRACGLANQCVGKGDAMPLLLNALERFPAMPALFEEAHHGYADARGGLWSALPDGVRIGLVQIAVALLGTIDLGTRTRPPVPLPGMERSRAEDLASLAGSAPAWAVPVVLEEEAAAFPAALRDEAAEVLLARASQRPSEAEALVLVRKLRELEEKAKDRLKMATETTTAIQQVAQSLRGELRKLLFCGEEEVITQAGLPAGGAATCCSSRGAWPGQDVAGQDAGYGAGRDVSSGAVHPGFDAVRHHRRQRPRPQDSTFVFRPGPIFTSVLLTDEMNRTPPKTQAALLQGIGGALRHRGRRGPPPAAVLLCHRDPEPDRVRGDLSLAQSRTSTRS